MTGLEMRVDFDDAKVKAAFASLVEKGGNLRPAMDDIGAALVTSTELRFERGEDPDGNPWLPSQRALRKGDKTLVDSERLWGSFIHHAGRDFVDVGTNVIYAAIHQFGGKTGRGHKVKMPERAFLGIDEDDRGEIVDIIADFLRGDLF